MQFGNKCKICNYTVLIVSYGETVIRQCFSKKEFKLKPIENRVF